VKNEFSKGAPTIEVEYEIGARVVTRGMGATESADGDGCKGTVVGITPSYEVRWDDDPASTRAHLRYRGEHIQRADPDVGDLFTGDDGPFIASLPDGTVVVNEDGNALLRCDGRWVDGWFGTFSSLYWRETFAVLHIPKEVV
jgi:hypothetical protein